MELSPKDQERYTRVAEFIKNHSHEIERYTILGVEEDEIPARTVLALFPRGEDWEMLTVGYNDNLFERDQDLIGFIDSRKIRLGKINDKEFKEDRLSKSELNDLPVAVLFVGEQGESVSVSMMTYDDLDPKTIFKDFQRLCVLKRSKNARLQ